MPSTDNTSNLETLAAAWRNASNASKAALFDQTVASGQWPELLQFLAREYPDPQSQFRLVDILKASAFLSSHKATHINTVASYFYKLEGGGIEATVCSLTKAFAKPYDSIAFVDNETGLPGQPLNPGRVVPLCTGATPPHHVTYC